MQNYLLLLRFSFIGFLLCLMSCTTSDKSVVPAKDDSTKLATQKETIDFFPVTDYLLSQVKELSTLATPLSRTEKKDTVVQLTTLKNDSSSLKNYYSDLLNPIIDSSRFVNNIRFGKFMDETLHAVTLTYERSQAITHFPEWHHWYVYIDPDKNDVKKIFLTKYLDERHQQQITWIHGESCLIRTFETDSTGTLKLIKETSDRFHQ